MTLGSSLGKVTFFEFLKLSAEIISITNAMAITEITEIKGREEGRNGPEERENHREEIDVTSSTPLLPLSCFLFMLLFHFPRALLGSSVAPHFLGLNFIHFHLVHLLGLGWASNHYIGFGVC